MRNESRISGEKRASLALRVMAFFQENVPRSQALRLDARRVLARDVENDGGPARRPAKRYLGRFQSDLVPIESVLEYVTDRANRNTSLTVRIVFALSIVQSLEPRLDHAQNSTELCQIETGARRGK